MENIKKIILLILFILLVLATYYLFNKGLTIYYVTTFIISIIIFIVLLKSLSLNNNQNELYDKEVYNILKVHNNILVECSEYPNITGKDLIKINSIEDIVDAQSVIKKPIFFVIQDDSCSFMIVDNEEVLIYIKKRNDQVENPLDKEFTNYQLRKEKDLNNINDVENILDDLDKTTILKLSNDKRFEIHPLNRESDEKEQLLKKLRRKIKENINNLDIELEENIEESDNIEEEIIKDNNNETVYET